ncbi:PIN domain-containing protein [Archaeoglobus fulgidus]|uniref:Ribonuclease VapC n=1 Tax=Archaeoglobus fulgidus DSM 8774 TaxID=1344584 RepID=A0A075WE32_ARCFL|nr:PIN domain-containing protein [Archaeoglobus fulgidus]AIG97957.1 putative nucleic acid-binding protein [Archaeoglobus fulgidus DSM 8774]
MRIFLDTNFIVNLIFETEFTETAKAILVKYADSDLITSISVIEETLFVLKRLTRKTNREIAELVANLLDGVEIEVLEKLPISVFLEVFREYDLLPNDALIAATCKHYDIKKIATFDEDFKRVDFLEVVKL